ncbi:MAG: tetratricopeptide repeat protein, partial [Leptolyngbyaceae cyanobacterium HOT.MB2.61]|nr:tetratricopeptide repeat protein [Leptolyngbyaceae cyanobacterium HOT.MB2.61]
SKPTPQNSSPLPPLPQSPLPEELKLAIRHQQAGRFREAEQVCYQILQQQNHPEVWHLLGLIAHRERRYNEAIAHYHQVLTLEPNHQDVCNNLAVALHEQGKLDEAIAQYQQALRLKPDYPDAHNNYANALRARGQVEEAIHHYRMAIAYNPGYADAYNNLGLALYAEGEFGQAADCYRQAIALRPNYPQAHNHLGNALKELGDFKQAVEHYRQAIALKPDYAKAYNNWGNIFRDEGDLTTAIQYYDQAIGIEPEFAEAHWNKALTLLIGGHLQQGFAEYEWRWRVKLPSFHPMRSFPAPLWDGSPLQGKTIFLHAEQGMGDIIQFVRYAALVAERGGKILLECHPPLVNLLKRIPHIQQVIPYGSTPPPFDVHAPLMSLAYILGTTLETVPAIVPYLTAPSEPALPLPEQDGDRETTPPPLKVGFVWSGNPENPYNRFRTIPLTHLLPLAAIPGVHLYSLQKDPSPADLELLAAHPEIRDLQGQLTDFVCTAALINQLDLVISVDTAITHLAGALGKPVWLLLPYAPDWRWLLGRSDSPWYPTLRLFRQPSQGDWAGVMEQVKRALLAQPGVEKPDPIAFSQPLEPETPRPSPEPGGFGKSQKQESRSQKKRSRKDASSLAAAYPLLETAFQQYNDSQLSEAEQTCRQILEQYPAQAEALHLLGVILCRNGQTEAAIAHFQQALQQQPDFADAWCNLGSALREQGQAEEAIAHYRWAISLNPNHADAHYNLAMALQEQDQLEEALIHCQQAAALKPDFVEAHYSLGFVLRRLGRLEEAIASYRRALHLAPNYPEAHKNLGHALLLKGDLATGFAEYEWRWQQKNWSPRSFSQPLWDGSSLSGKTILLHAEQGMGDTIQFIRYVSLVKRCGGKVIVECQPLLRRLLETVSDIDHLVPQGSPLPPFDVHAPLLSLPHILGTTLDSIPANIPYLSPPSPLPASLTTNNQLTTDLPPFLLKIGLVWAGNPAHKNDRYRSCKLEWFQSLLDLPGICFYSLQKGDAAADLQRFQFPIHDLGAELEDFADTAAAIAQLDLVISVDTAVAHLAGALGKPVWLLLSYAPDWRWLLERQDSPWYPTLRIFRQKQPGDWQSVFEQLQVALREWKEANAVQNRSDLESNISAPGKTQIALTGQPDLVSSSGIYSLYLALQLLKDSAYDLVIPEATDIQSFTPLYRELLRPALARSKNCSTKCACGMAIHFLSDSFLKAPLPESDRNLHSVGLFLATDTHLTPAAIAHARTYTKLLTGSTWSTEILQEYGLNPVQIPLQGMEPTLFSPGSRANLFGDRFIIFAGGELSYTKGADIVISAFKAFHSRHPEALLVTAWYRVEAIAPADHLLQLPDSIQNGASQWLAERGLTSDSFIELGAVPYPQLGQILREVDVALFPSRCEAGLNPLAIASLACAVPTLLSANTAHLDLVRHNLGYPLRAQRSINLSTTTIGTAGWGESDIEEIVETLEWIYTNRQEATYRGTAAADFVQAWTWERQIQGLIKAIA